MGGGGAMAMAAQAIRNNKKLLSKRKGRSLSIVTNSNKRTEYNLPNATPEKLLEIKMRMQLEHRHRRIKQIMLLSIIMLSIIVTLLYFA